MLESSLEKLLRRDGSWTRYSLVALFKSRNYNATTAAIGNALRLTHAIGLNKKSSSAVYATIGFYKYKWVIKMKFKTFSAFLCMAFVSAANADVALTQADILGRWKIDAESFHRNGSGAKPLDTEWVFNQDGTMIGTSADTAANASIKNFSATLHYSVENGMLKKQIAPGRDKYETCAAIEKDGAKMVLKCKSVYFFMTKQ